LAAAVLAVSLTACGPDTAASPPAKAHTSVNSAKASPSHPASTTPSSVATTITPPPASAPAVPGVVSECTSAPPLRLSVDPVGIALACADNGWGVERMSWNDWGSTVAKGQGTFFEKLCQPNCAEGTIGTYPVEVTLSGVKSSSHGPWFSSLSVSWEGARPPGTTPPSFPLTPPTN